MTQHTLALLTTALMSMLPIIELKGAIPIGLIMGLNLAEAFTVAYIFSSLPTPFILLLLKPIIKFARRFEMIDRFFTWFVDSSIKKSARIQKYEYLGLFIFVAIPLPGTGIWTGSTIASIFDMDFKKSLLCVVVGNLIAGALILGLSALGVWTLGGVG